MDKAKVRRIILSIYADSPELVNHRTALLAAVWRDCGWNNNKSLEDNLEAMPSAETVSRRLRELHQEGLVSYTEKELERRTEAFTHEIEQHSAFKWFDRKRG